jgi:hypothetical protein
LLLATAGAAVVPNAAGRGARLALAAYGLVVGGVAVSSRGGWRAVPVLVTIHGVWGAGLVAGLGGLLRRSLMGDGPR